MRELRPLLLPKLVAAKTTKRKSIEDMSSHRARSPPSCESFHSSATVSSDCSSPVTPTFSLRGHSRYPSSNSSLASTPPTHDNYMENQGSTTKLPKLTEEPQERDDPMDDFVVLGSDASVVSPCLCDDDHCEHQPRSMSFNKHALFDSFSSESDFTAEHFARQRTSLELNSRNNSITARLENRFPSLSRRFRDGKRTSGLSIKTRNSASWISSRAPSGSRSSSLTGSIVQSFEKFEEQPAATPIDTPLEVSDEKSPTAAIDIVRQSIEVGEPIDREAMASTPLLPPTLMSLRDEATPSQSPLQSPTVADSAGTFSFGNTPAGTPRLSAMGSPPLSTRPSCSSLHASRSTLSVAAPDVPPLKMSDLDDKWSATLGHANFTIFPEPYIPDECDASSCRKLFTDWEEARRNFTKHQVRTGEHFGVTSKAYKLTEQKWAEIDSLWKKFYDLAISAAGLEAREIRASSQAEPAPLVKLPSLTNKFPAKGDEDIVGPMVQAASQLPPMRSKKTSFVKFFTAFRFLSKPSLGPRSRR